MFLVFALIYKCGFVWKRFFFCFKNWHFGVATVNVLKFKRRKIFKFILVSQHVQILISITHFDKELVIVCFWSKRDVDFVHIFLMIFEWSIACPHLLINIRIFIYTMILNYSWIIAQVFNWLNLRRWIWHSMLSKIWHHF